MSGVGGTPGRSGGPLRGGGLAGASTGGRRPGPSCPAGSGPGTRPRARPRTRLDGVAVEGVERLGRDVEREHDVGPLRRRASARRAAGAPTGAGRTRCGARSPTSRGGRCRAGGRAVASLDRPRPDAQRGVEQPAEHDRQPVLGEAVRRHAERGHPPAQPEADERRDVHALDDAEAAGRDRDAGGMLARPNAISRASSSSDPPKARMNTHSDAASSNQLRLAHSTTRAAAPGRRSAPRAAGRSGAGR